MSITVEDRRVERIATELQEIKHSVDWGTVEPLVPVRLQCHEGHDTVRWGDPSYDTDHRGYWGASYLGPDDTWSDMVQIARDLVDQAEEQRALAEV